MEEILCGNEWGGNDCVRGYAGQADTTWVMMRTIPIIFYKLLGLTSRD